MKNVFLIFLFAPFVAFWNGCKKKDEYKDLNCATVNSTYTDVIKPIIETNCTGSGCHGTKSSNGDYTTYEGLLIRVNNGTLSKRVLYAKDMPQAGSLSLDDRKKIKCWLDSGAPRN